jgi:hypothetical protein
MAESVIEWTDLILSGYKTYYFPARYVADMFELFQKVQDVMFYSEQLFESFDYEIPTG